MRKPKTKNIILLSILFLLIAVIVAFNVYCFTATLPRVNTDKNLSDWMGYINDDVLLKNVVMPGSHDSGTQGMLWVTETQHLTVEKQLEQGSRYFDMRVATYDDEKKDYGRIYHGPIKGKSLPPILESVTAFLTAHPTETVILDFQHFDVDEAKQVAFSDLEKAIPDSLRLKNETELNDTEFIDQLTLGTARGKCVIFWSSGEDYIARPDFFRRGNDDGTRPDSALHSYYVTELNSLPSSEFIETALPQYINKYVDEAKTSGIFVLQCQLTDGKYVFGPKFREASHVKNMSNAVNGLRESGDLQYINVVMRDYVTLNKCANVIALNCFKTGNVKSDKLQEFKDYINIFLKDNKI